MKKLSKKTKTQKNLNKERFGNWTVLRESKTRRLYLTCLCKCGTIRDIPNWRLKRENPNPAGA